MGCFDYRHGIKLLTTGCRVRFLCLVIYQDPFMNTILCHTTPFVPKYGGNLYGKNIIDYIAQCFVKNQLVLPILYDKTILNLPGNEVSSLNT